MNMVVPVRIVSRSAIQARHDCEVLRFLQYDAPIEGAVTPGLERIESSLPLIGGTTVHNMLARAVQAEGREAAVDRIIAEELQAYEKTARAGIYRVPPEELDHVIGEQRALAEGQVRGWVTHRLPLVLEEYYPVSIEQEWRAPLDSTLVQPIRMDIIMRRRHDSMLSIRDYKTVSWLGNDWADRYRTDLQTVLYVRALEDATGEPVEGICYEALLRGQRRMAWKIGRFANMKVQQSPFCYGYANRVGGVTTYQVEYTNKANWHRVASWQEMPVKEWVQRVLPETKARELFSTTVPFHPSAIHTTRVIAATIRGEAEYAAKLERVHALVAEGYSLVDAAHAVLEARVSRCMKFGLDYPCPAYDICHDPTVGEDPLASGLYKSRVDHHAEED